MVPAMDLQAVVFLLWLEGGRTLLLGNPTLTRKGAALLPKERNS